MTSATPDLAGTAERLLAAISDYAIYMLSLEGHVVSWNPGAQRFKGYLPHEIIGQHFRAFHTPEDRDAGIPERSLQIAQAQGKYECEGWRVRRDGTRFWASVVIDPILDDDGALLGFAKITRDITDKKRASDELFASEQQLRILVNGVTDYALFMLSPEGMVSNWNSGARRIKGYEAAEVLGRHFSMFYPREERERGAPQQALAQAAQTGRFEAEGWRVRRDGSRFLAHVVIDAIRDEQGVLLGFAKITRDISEREASARSLERAREELFQSQKMEAIGQLTGGVAHDFNNLLSIISSGVQILEAQGLATSQKTVLESISRAVARGSSLTQQLLAFARQQPLSPAVHDANRIISAFETVLRRGVNANVDLRLLLAPDLRPVNIDDARLEATLLNLVVNARDAMPAGGVLEVITANVRVVPGQHSTLAPGDYVRIAVRDSGTGMAPEVQARACEPFFTTKPIGKGTGLGLSQVQGFIVQSGGALEVDSTPGVGTTITILLPAVDGDALESAAVTDTEVALIVEDEEELGKLAGSLFETLGYTVMLASNGEQALRMLREQDHVDVLFSDVMMPGMTGIELARAARQIVPGLRVVLASGYPQPALRAQGDIDEFAFISKPYRLSEIVRKLR